VRQGRERMFVLMFEKGDELVSGLEDFARKNKVLGGQVNATGNLSSVTFGSFDSKQKRYNKTQEIRGPLQVLSLTGDIAHDKGRPRLVCHVVVAKEDGSVLGGHVMQAHVQQLLEVVVVEASQFYQRQYDRESGLALLRPEPQVIGRTKRRSSASGAS
jgi:uncharacterized protein